MKQLLSLTLVSVFAISACGGGSGSGGGGSNGGNGIGGGGGIVKPTPKSSGNVVSLEANSAIVTREGRDYPILESVNVGDTQYDIDDNGNLVIDGKVVSKSEVHGVRHTEDLYPLGPIFAAYIDDDGNNRALAGYFTAEEYVEQADKKGLAFTKEFSTSSWTWTDVDYGYIIADGANSLDHVSDSDGTINVKDDQWSAQFGDARLEGKVEGYEVSGTAKLDGMSGEFKGVDGLYMDDYGDTKLGPYTTGAFAGDNNTDKSFAGGWYGEDFDGD